MPKLPSLLPPVRNCLLYCSVWRGWLENWKTWPFHQSHCARRRLPRRITRRRDIQPAHCVNKQMSVCRNPSWRRVCGGEASSLPRSSAAVPSTDAHAASATQARRDASLCKHGRAPGVHVHGRWGRSCDPVLTSVILLKFWCLLNIGVCLK